MGGRLGVSDTSESVEQERGAMTTNVERRIRARDVIYDRMANLVRSSASKG